MYIHVSVALHGVAREADDHPAVPELSDGFDGGGSVHGGHLVVHHYYIEQAPIATYIIIIFSMRNYYL